MQASVSNSKNDLQNLRRKAKEKLLKYKLYKWIAILLAVGALIVTVNLHLTLADGNSNIVSRRPFLIVIFLLPFVPPVFMGILSKRMYSQAMRDLEPLRKSS